MSWGLGVFHNTPEAPGGQSQAGGPALQESGQNVKNDFLPPPDLVPQEGALDMRPLYPGTSRPFSNAAVPGEGC